MLLKSCDLHQYFSADEAVRCNSRAASQSRAFSIKICSTPDVSWKYRTTRICANLQDLKAAAAFKYFTSRRKRLCKLQVSFVIREFLLS